MSDHTLFFFLRNAYTANCVHLLPVVPAHSTLINSVRLNPILTSKSSFIIWKETMNKDGRVSLCVDFDFLQSYLSETHVYLLVHGAPNQQQTCQLCLFVLHSLPQSLSYNLDKSKENVK